MLLMKFNLKSDGHYQIDGNVGESMGTLAELNAGQIAVVTKIEAMGELKQRLFSFGLRKGSVLKIKATSIARSTMEIEIGTTLLALRYEEAKFIHVDGQ